MSHLLPPHSLDQLKGLQFSLPRLFERSMAGRHQTAQQGSSVEFAQHRDYAPGDPIRHIDWKAFARSEKFVIKEFESESNLQVLLIVDSSESMNFRGGSTLTKQAFACQVAHGFAWLLLNQGDAVGLISFSEGVPTYVPPSSIGGQLSLLETHLESMESSANTRFEDLTAFINSKCHRNTVCIVITDFLDDEESNAQHFVELKRRRYPTYCLHVLSPNEYELTEEDPTIYRDEERDESTLSEPEAIKKAYDQLISEWLANVSAECRHHGIPYELVMNQTDPVLVIRQLIGGYA